MRRDDPNLEYMMSIAQALGELRDEVVFVGGCAAGLLITDPAASRVRPTRDVDAVVESTTLVDYARIEARLFAKGFVRDEQDYVICRWRHRESKVLFDLMPSHPQILGFSNRWYPAAIQTATRVTLGRGLEIHLVSAPAFVATKLEAFADRGKGDYRP